MTATNVISLRERRAARSATQFGNRLPTIAEVVADDSGLLFLRLVRTLPPEAQDRLVPMLRAMLDGKPAALTRAAALDWLHAMGCANPERQADKLMRSGIRFADGGNGA